MVEYRHLLKNGPLPFSFYELKQFIFLDFNIASTLSKQQSITNQVLFPSGRRYELSYLNSQTQSFPISNRFHRGCIREIFFCFVIT